MKYRLRRVVQVDMTVILIGIVAATVGITGCSDRGDDGEHRPGATQPANSAEIIREATKFGGIVIPDNASVLDSRSEHGRDTLYQLAMQTDPQGLASLLEASNFSAPLVKVFRIAETIIAGPPLETSPSILRAEDVYSRPDGKSVNRIVVVDERNQGDRFVHIQLFDT
jgi:hypothetical protein